MSAVLDDRERRLAGLVVALGMLLALLPATAPTPAAAQEDPDAPDALQEDPDAPDALQEDRDAPAALPVDQVPTGWPEPDGLDVAAYVLVEAATGQVLAAQEPDTKRAVASTVKVLTALVVVERTELDDEVTVGDEVLDVPGSGVGLEPGDTWTIEELLDALIARSGNEAAEALAVHVGGDVEGFLDLMSEEAAALGLGEVPFVSPSGLDDDNQLSARDLATIGRAALEHPELRPILGRRQVVLPSEGQLETRNELLLAEPDATGVKTGFTNAAGYSLVGSVLRDGRELVAVVLGAGEDPARFTAAAELLDLGFDDYRPATLEARIGYLVAGGELALVVDPISLTTPVDAPAALDLPVTARPPDGALEVEVVVDTEVIATVPAEFDDTDAPAEVDGPAALGRAAVDGVYAALRATAADDQLR